MFAALRPQCFVPAAMKPRFLLTLTVFSCALLSACALFAQPNAPHISNSALDELSGLAVSHADPTLLWGHNDSGDGPNLFRIGLAGEDLGMITVDGADAIDWEDIAAFDWHGQPALLIADIGDNNAKRDHLTLYAVTDPGVSGPAKLLWKLDFRYPDGPRDCEAVAVDPIEHSILLLSKREFPQHLYRLPLPDTQPAPGLAIAESLNNAVKIQRPTLVDLVENPGFGQYSGMPTAMDIARDGSFAVVVTYKNAYRFRRAPGESWGGAFAAVPETIVQPRLRQTEAGAISADGRHLFISSEGHSAPLVRLPLAP